MREGIKFHFEQIHSANGTILFSNEGQRLLVRHVPVPPALIIELSISFQSNRTSSHWPQKPISRAKGWRIINAAMKFAGITGKRATSTGLRHSFAISCFEIWPQISLHQVQ
jgi:integrase